eukprot:CAMPEP_0114575690 /NCGR_PEP_ID=MMETSP0125-20121206/538_1 /TAXON_ID=485358 ORGANISM="Aristerostoma sp., Strain ATCC 50986" /NCGR_SAMPLE_ID=MMETSP0125 /ASSEMBLY_ACC=CAM_ASM_000245 /LENGTH=52 /DNA_ID=CAMNT_0001763629 /DNA_START=251 /DNA_END=409 /DNA_ORIENTATION=-
MKVSIRREVAGDQEKKEKKRKQRVEIAAVTMEKALLKLKEDVVDPEREKKDL